MRLAVSVSTHSRPKAAGQESSLWLQGHVGFNTQPPEGGWADKDGVIYPPYWFQHTAARRRLARPKGEVFHFSQFQHTAARRRLVYADDGTAMALEFQHTAARRRLGAIHTAWVFMMAFQHTAARRRLDANVLASTAEASFQHTAARRRLGFAYRRQYPKQIVSTHSRPKAAGPFFTAKFVLE